MVKALLAESMRLAVPLEIARVSQMGEGQRDWLAGQLAPRLQAGADEMLYGGKRAREAFAAYARALALCSFQPGGVTFAGLHWCSDHTPLCEQVAAPYGRSWLERLTGKRVTADG